MRPLVVIGCPVRNRAWVLRDFLGALETIEYYPRSFLFHENNSDDGTGELLDGWASQRGDVVVMHGRGPAPGHRRNERGRDGYAYLAGVRNTLLDVVVRSGADYLLSVDSDVIVPPDIVDHLLELADERTIVGAAISNIAGRPLDGRTAGNFMVEAGGIVHPASYPTTGVLEVAVTGACCIIPRALLERGVRYGPHPQGEDIAFCQAARAAGGRVLVTFDVRPDHRMEEKQCP
jgi:GT2 family glycosyltransferase